MKLRPSRVHLVEPLAKPRPPKPEPVIDYLGRGLAWARVQILTDGRVIVDGRRGSVTLDEEHAAQVVGLVRNLGVRER